VPSLSAWALRAALFWLAVAALVGALILARDALGLPALARLIPIHAEMMLVGWTMQLAFGVAHWILPRHPTREVRGPVTPVVLVLLTLNVGVILVIVGATLAGRVLEGLAVAGFAMQGVPRIRASVWGATGKEGDLVALKKRPEPI
jgi:hypothetical protein